MREEGWERRSKEPQGPEHAGLQAEAEMQEFLLNEWEIREGLEQEHDMF